MVDKKATPFPADAVAVFQNPLEIPPPFFRGDLLLCRIKDVQIIFDEEIPSVAVKITGTEYDLESHVSYENEYGDYVKLDPGCTLKEAFFAARILYGNMVKGLIAQFVE